jgi:hypothetical protein
VDSMHPLYVQSPTQSDSSSSSSSNDRFSDCTAVEAQILYAVTSSNSSRADNSTTMYRMDRSVVCNQLYVTAAAASYCYRTTLTMAATGDVNL